mmetsp:Transcript_9375/g.39389  ORF Transcript_9375/g.39389 Transcript_9375/m.39389 type:complete len:244 (+) Transcript_9375:124-855(+)
MSSAAAPAQHSAATASAPATVSLSFPGPHRSRSTSSHSSGFTNAPTKEQHCATTGSMSAARDALESERESERRSEPAASSSDVFENATLVCLSRLVAAHTLTNAKHSCWQCCVAFSSRNTRLARRSLDARVRASSCHPIISPKIGFTTQGKLFFTRTRAPRPGRAANGGGYATARGSMDEISSERDDPKPKCSGAYVMVAFRSFSCSRSYCEPSSVNNKSAASWTLSASSAKADMTYGKSRGS